MQTNGEDKMLIAGQVLSNRYRIIKTLGSGGAGVVYLAFDDHLQKYFAVKELSQDSYSDTLNQAVGKLVAEANIMNRLNHPLLPRIIDVLEIRGVIFVVMDYIEGEGLDKVLKRYGVVPEAYVVHWFKQLCDALFYLHGSNPPIIHRDLKPSNIILTKDGSVRLIDFGAAREQKQRRRNAGDTNSFGTWGYAAPEQFDSSRQTDGRTDIYSLGVTMHALLTGQDPCDGANALLPIRQYNSSLSPELESIIEKCTRFSPAERYQNCSELLYALDRLDSVSASRGKSSVSVAAIVSIAISAVALIGTLIAVLLSG